MNQAQILKTDTMAQRMKELAKKENAAVKNSWGGGLSVEPINGFTVKTRRQAKVLANCCGNLRHPDDLVGVPTARHCDTPECHQRIKNWRVFSTNRGGGK